MADGAHGAKPQTIDGFERDAAIGRGLAQADAEFGLRPCGQRIAARRLARLRATQFQHVPAGRLTPEVVIEGDDAMDLGAREVQRLRRPCGTAASGT